MNFPVALHIPESLPRSVFLLAIFPPETRSDSKRSPNAREQNPHRPRVRGGSLFFSLRDRGPRARSSRTRCAATFARVRGELARAPSPARWQRGEPQSARGCEGSVPSSECSHDKWVKEKTNFLMLARRAEGQKPRRALSFQNARQSFVGSKIKNA